jgi:hypothetical protein
MSETSSYAYVPRVERSPQDCAAAAAMLRRQAWRFALPLMIVVSTLSVARLAVIGFSLLILVPAGAAWIVSTMALMLRAPRRT